MIINRFSESLLNLFPIFVVTIYQLKRGIKIKFFIFALN
jgi:hypothetical protein